MKIIKSLIKKLPGYRFLAKKIIRPTFNIIQIMSSYKYDLIRFLKYGGHKESEESLIAAITMAYHVAEKGLTMPNMRVGFGHDNLFSLIEMLNKYGTEYNCKNEQFKHAVAVVAEYYETHKTLNYRLENKLEEAITDLLEKWPISPSEQIEMTKSEYYKYVNSDFMLFSNSRHSVRNFEGNISAEQIQKAVEIANNAPSACNRQPCKVHLVSDKEIIKDCLALQNGNRGFGHLADKLLIITADVRHSWPIECLDVRTNAGIYIMNLCYALHYNKVAHCILNWFAPPRSNRLLQKILKFSPAEVIVAFILCGDVPERFKLAGSRKRAVAENLIIH